MHENIAPVFLPKIAKRLVDSGVQLLGCKKTCTFLDTIKPATDEDYHNEYLDMVLNIKVVDSIDDAISHITKYGSGHSEAIITTNYSNALQFTGEVDAAAVYVNASTRFTDGYEFGMGAEIGISTDKLHARGPMGLAELTSYKFVVFGNGQLRE